MGKKKKQAAAAVEKKVDAPAVKTEKPKAEKKVKVKKEDVQAEKVAGPGDVIGAID